MKKYLLIPLVSSLFLTSGLFASQIASESFSTSGSASDYTTGVEFNVAANNDITAGNSGFNSADNWAFGTVLIEPSDAGGLTHNLLVGSTANGYALVRGGGPEIFRHSQRALASPPASGSTFFVSGLVSAVNGIADLRNDDRFMMGIAPAATFNSRDFDLGFQLGVIKNSSGDVFLSAFADDSIHTFGSALTNTQASGDIMIVLEANLGPNLTGDDTLTAYYALDGDTSLTLGTTVSSITIANTVADLSHFGLITKANGSSHSGGNSGMAFDEFRFGTTLDAVAVPEPAAGALFFGLGAVVLLMLNRRR